MLVIHPQYEHLREWIASIPDTFSQQGEIIYNARNQIRVMTAPDGVLYNVKRFCVPKWYNRLSYSWFRTPKAQRAYTNAMMLQERNIPTPSAVAYILCGKILRESYLITKQLTYTHRLYEWGDGLTKGREECMRAFGRFTAQMHLSGILHKDYSPGNILFEKVNDQWQFAIVDINRMRIGPVSVVQGCNNMGRLWGEEDVYRLIAEGYAAECNMNPNECYQHMWHAHQQFWKQKIKPIEYQSKVHKNV